MFNDANKRVFYFFCYLSFRNLYKFTPTPIKPIPMIKNNRLGTEFIDVVGRTKFAPVVGGSVLLRFVKVFVVVVVGCVVTIGGAVVTCGIAGGGVVGTVLVGTVRFVCAGKVVAVLVLVRDGGVNAEL